MLKSPNNTTSLFLLEISDSRHSISSENLSNSWPGGLYIAPTSIAPDLNGTRRNNPSKVVTLLHFTGSYGTNVSSFLIRNPTPPPWPCPLGLWTNWYPGMFIKSSVFLSIQVYIHTNIHTYKHKYNHTHKHTYQHTYRHTYKHAHIRFAVTDLPRVLPRCH